MPTRASYLRGREQVQRIPPLAPRVANPRIRIQDHKGHAATSQVVSNGQAGLAGAYHYCLNLRDTTVRVHDDLAGAA